MARTIFQTISFFGVHNLTVSGIKQADTTIIKGHRNTMKGLLAGFFEQQ